METEIHQKPDPTFVVEGATAKSKEYKSSGCDKFQHN
jgi:hypothetical protein